MKELILIKLGGAAITDKNKEYTLKENIIQQVMKEIRESGITPIIIHGAGSFAHIIAKEYGLSNGLSDEVEVGKQISAISKIRLSMMKLTSFITQVAIEYDLDPFPIAISSTLVSDGPDKEANLMFESVEHALKNKMIPILHGDMSFDKQNHFRVISGDRIINLLAEYFKDKEEKVRVIFGSNIDGLYDRDPNDYDDAKLIPKILPNQIKQYLETAGGSAGIDVTGGMYGKLKSIEGIVKKGIEVNLVNICKSDRLLKKIRGEEVLSSDFITRI
jgi:isopentenyl phosphate kinase